MGIGKVESLVVILIIVLVLFGGKKLPELSKAIGQSFKEIRKGFNDDDTKPSDKKSDRTPA